MFSKPTLEQSGKQLLKQNYKKQNEPNNKNKKRRFSSMEVQTQGLKRKIPTTHLTYIGRSDLVVSTSLIHN
jgi:hypothetical protein